MKNVGSGDAAIRAFLGGALLLLSASLQHRPLLAVATGFIALMVLGTALFRVCPFYTVFRVSTVGPDTRSR